MGPSKQLAENMRAWRYLNRVSQTELGVRIGMTQQQVAHLESGEANFTLRTAERVAAVIGGFVLEWSPH